MCCIYPNDPLEPESKSRYWRIAARSGFKTSAGQIRVAPFEVLVPATGIETASTNLRSFCDWLGVIRRVGGRSIFFGGGFAIGLWLDFLRGGGTSGDQRFEKPDGFRVVSAGAIRVGADDGSAFGIVSDSHAAKRDPAHRDAPRTAAPGKRRQRTVRPARSRRRKSLPPQYPDRDKARGHVPNGDDPPRRSRVPRPWHRPAPGQWTAAANRAAWWM